MSLTLSHLPLHAPALSDGPPCSTETTTPADRATRGTRGMAIKRASLQAAMSREERRAYRRGYLAAAQHLTRLRAVLRGAQQSLSL